MVDTPKIFIILVVTLILSISVINFATKKYVEEAEKQSTFIISLDTPAKKTAPAPEGAGALAPPPSPSYQPPTTSIVPSVKTDYTIKYTKNGFEPQTLRVKLGQSVRFLNEGSSTMWVAAARSPNSTELGELNQGRSVGQGGFYDFTFSRKGTFVYYNLNNKAHAGAIAVE